MSVSDLGYERFDPADVEVIRWLNSELVERLAHRDNGTVIGNSCKGFDFLGVDYPATSSSSPHLSSLSPSRVSLQRLSQKLQHHFSSCTWLYEHGRLKNIETIKCYLKHWLSWAKGIGIATLNSLAAIATTLQRLCTETQCRMTQTFAQWILQWVDTQTININYETNKNPSCTMGPRSIRHSCQPQLCSGSSGKS